MQRVKSRPGYRTVGIQQSETKYGMESGSSLQPPFNSGCQRAGSCYVCLLPSHKEDPDSDEKAARNAQCKERGCEASPRSLRVSSVFGQSLRYLIQSQGLSTLAWVIPGDLEAAPLEEGNWGGTSPGIYGTPRIRFLDLLVSSVEQIYGIWRSGIVPGDHQAPFGVL